MLLGIFADSHDHLDHLRRAVEVFNTAQCEQVLFAGDLVLSQHPTTGELTYKPVLKTTITPEGPLMKVEAGNYDTFRCTAGHLFWVSGEGWKQARELRSGAQLHTPRGTVTVSHVEDSKAEQTYNLIVADFHTYFAGERDVLCHDNTLRQPTRAIVPGVVAK